MPTDHKSRAAYADTRYRKALKIALRWIKNYTELDFRSLGSYTRADLDKIAAAPTRSRPQSSTGTETGATPGGARRVKATGARETRSSPSLHRTRTVNSGPASGDGKSLR
jgi:hypothetical protein